jgi:hypothetical protein
MGSWLLLVVVLLIVRAEPAKQKETFNQATTRCGQEECEKFQGCFEGLKDTVQSVHSNVSALVSEKSKK